MIAIALSLAFMHFAARSLLMASSWAGSAPTLPPEAGACTNVEWSTYPASQLTAYLSPDSPDQTSLDYVFAGNVSAVAYIAAGLGDRHAVLLFTFDAAMLCPMLAEPTETEAANMTRELGPPRAVRQGQWHRKILLSAASRDPNVIPPTGAQLRQTRENDGDWTERFRTALLLQRDEFWRPYDVVVTIKGPRDGFIERADYAFRNPGGFGANIRLERRGTYWVEGTVNGEALAGDVLSSRPLLSPIGMRQAWRNLFEQGPGSEGTYSTFYPYRSLAQPSIFPFRFVEEDEDGTLLTSLDMGTYTWEAAMTPDARVVEQTAEMGEFYLRSWRVFAEGEAP